MAVLSSIATWDTEMKKSCQTASPCILFPNSIKSLNVDRSGLKTLDATTSSPPSTWVFVLCTSPPSPTELSTDTNTTRRKRKAEAAAVGEGPTPRKKLKVNAIPELFPSIYAENHAQPTVKTDRTETAHAEARWTVQQRKEEERIEQFLAKDRVQSLADIDRKFETDFETVPAGFIRCRHDDKLLLLLIDYPSPLSPRLRASITISSELTYSVTVDGETVAASKIDKDKNLRIGHFTKLTTVMSQVKQWVEGESAPKPEPLETAKEALETYLRETDDGPLLTRKVAFLLEQIQLLCNEYQELLSDPNGKQVKFLLELCDFLQAWQDSGKEGLGGGLTKDTFRAVRHTCKTMVEIARYCLGTLGWAFVMLGKFSSDPIEGQFSDYRQTQGGNFLIGVKQILESEKKLRAIKLIKYSGCSLSELRKLKDMDTIRNDTAVAVAKHLTPRIAALLNTQPKEPNNTDSNIILYVCGAMVHSHMNATKECGPCQRLLLNNGRREKMPDLSTEDSIPEKAAAFVEQVNRGGLLIPSSLMFGLGVKCWKVFKCIRKDKQLSADFLKETNHRAVFIEIMLNLLEDESEIEDVLVNDLTCADGHQFGRILITKYFNCMCKNWIKEMSTAVKPGNERQIAKLQSKPAK